MTLIFWMLIAFAAAFGFFVGMMTGDMRGYERRSQEKAQNIEWLKTYRERRNAR